MDPIRLAGMGTILTRGSTPPASLNLPVPPAANLPGHALRSRSIALPDGGSEPPPLPADLAAKPIYVEPMLDIGGADDDWRAWQAARQRATAQAQQVERDNLTRTLQDWLRR
jgi:hypothetical protein